MTLFVYVITDISLESIPPFSLQFSALFFLFLAIFKGLIKSGGKNVTVYIILVIVESPMNCILSFKSCSIIINYFVSFE